MSRPQLYASPSRIQLVVDRQTKSMASTLAFKADLSLAGFFTGLIVPIFRSYAAAEKLIRAQRASQVRPGLPHTLQLVLELRPPATTDQPILLPDGSSPNQPLIVVGFPDPNPQLILNFPPP